MTENHEHQWEPDGDSWKIQVDSCPFDNKDYEGKGSTIERAMDNFECITEHDHEYVRKRRYTCYCGASKVVKLENGC